ncbi:NfeD family protein [Pseudomonas mangiferae]|uniref:NfeD family protein n=1 Tax=Pseudomonas mangiferae TaxID=2593654 RepID=A0A553H4T5_9PSED|nr:NfeD family protein [Pseudomonas mangiferae]TRX76694.1 NfeD family protein [Pseudomonas mangiferae]
MDVLWWMWLVLGVVLALMEIFTTTFFLLWFGIGAVLVGVVTALWPALPVPGQLALWALSSSLLAVLWFRVLKRRLPDKRWTSDEVIGEVGLLTVAVAPFQKGRVRFQKPILGNEEWVCTADSDIAAGERIRILSVEGNTVRVAKV